jgi:hypothetical protein
MPPFEDMYFGDRLVRIRACDCPGCTQAGDYRAPKDRELNDYYWFCLNHVREYNKGWDYFAGLPITAIEHHIRMATVWERPSWPLGQWRLYEEKMRDHVMREFFGEMATETPVAPIMPVAERDALAVLELIPPVSFVAIKAQYKCLVKRHHPDANSGSVDSEEKFKNINQAYAILKYKYETDDID